MEKNAMKLVALILSFVAQAACVIGLAIPYWLYYNKSGIEVYEGLWEGCSKDGCYRFDSLPLLVPAALKATRAMELIGMLLICKALILAILKLTVMKHHPRMPIWSGLSMISAGVCMIVGTIIYATKVRDQLDPEKEADLHAGFALCTGGGVLAIYAGICFLVFGRQAGSYSEI